MSQCQPCRPGAFAPARPLQPPAPLRGPRDAIDVLLVVASQPHRPEAIALVLDHAHRGITCMVVDGAGSPELCDVADVLLSAVAGRRRVGAFVLATTEPRTWLAGGGRPDAECELAWFDLRERFESAGYELLDWFVLSGGLALSMAEHTDSRSCWLDGTNG
jgi:hypothetical protein